MDCTIETCSREMVAKGLCNAHYKRNKRHGDPLAGRSEVGEGCTVDGCERRRKAYGLCRLHFRRASAITKEDMPHQPAERAPRPKVPHERLVRPLVRPRYQSERRPFLLTVADAAWAAGFFDGEGCVNTPNRAHINLGVGQVVKAPLLKFQELFGGSLGIDHAKRERSSDAWRWHLSGSRCADVLEAMLPYLVVKREVAELGMVLARMIRQERGMAWSRIGLSEEEVAERTALANAIRLLNANERPVQRL